MTRVCSKADYPQRFLDADRLAGDRRLVWPIADRAPYNFHVTKMQWIMGWVDEQRGHRVNVVVLTVFMLLISLLVVACRSSEQGGHREDGARC